jgi:hypothetical protein
MQGQHINIARLSEVRMQTVQLGVCGFVRDDVVRQAGKNDAPRQVAPGILF